MASGDFKVTTPTDNEIVMTREFNAPRDLVFEAHTSCEHMSRWFGPRKYEVVHCEIDFREGGKWRIVHKGPDGEEHGFRGEYLEIIRPEKITWTFLYEGAPGEPGPETLTLEERDGKTFMTTKSVFPSKEVRDQVLGSGMTEGAAETWERLEEYLAELEKSTSR
jgi:uncharacterized protein YndB with AHSA1/START domain